MTPTKFEIGSLYAISIGGLSSTLYKVIRRTAKTITFEYFDGEKTFKVKNSPLGEYVCGHKCLHAYSYGMQTEHEYWD